ncbi:MAG: hypothetical protein HRT57_07180, partial [Crocinitomicaceae bacterium]|nr:hypothetical protein [Crocinitomicaceae bacterium]
MKTNQIIMLIGVLVLGLAGSAYVISSTEENKKIKSQEEKQEDVQPAIDAIDFEHEAV